MKRANHGRCARSSRGCGALLLVVLPALIFPSPVAATQGGAEPDEAIEEDGVIVVKLHEALDYTWHVRIERYVNQAKAAGHEHIIFEIDTPGGEVSLMADLARQLLQVEDLETVAYVQDHAWSAGALITLACKRIYMSPTASIGAAKPVAIGVDMDEGFEEKMVSAIRTEFRTIAERRGRPGFIAAAMVDRDLELYAVLVDGRQEFLPEEEIVRRELDPRVGSVERQSLVIERGKLLTLGPEDAVRFGLADGIAETRGELLRALGYRGGGVIEGLPNWSEKLVSFLNSISFILLVAGCVFIYIEAKTPGFGLPGILGIVCFSLLLFGNYLAGLAEIPEILLVLLGLCLIGIEVFVTPGFGVAGIAGIVALLLGILLSMQDFVIPTTSFEADVFRNNMVEILLGFFSLGVIAPFLSKLLPKVPLFNRLLLTSDTAALHGGGAPLTEEVTGARGDGSLVGRSGTAVTDLRPAGKARVDGHLLDVMAEGPFIARGSEVTILAASGNRIVVRAVGPAPDEGSEDRMT